MDLVYILLVGLVAGWLAGRIMKKNRIGLVGSLIVGVIGAFVGEAIFMFLDISVSSLLARLVSAVVGAIVLLYLLQFLKRL